MKAILMTLVVGFLGFSSPVLATELDCQISENLTVIAKNHATTQVDQKIAVAKAPNIIAYVTEKSSQNFVVEAFIYDQEVRLYAEGILRQAGEKVSASLWSRSALYEISCAKPL